MIDETASPHLSEAGARSTSRSRDGAGVNSSEVRFTNPADYIADLKLDAELNAITDGLVRLAIVSGPATLEQIEGKWSAGGHRIIPTWRSKYVQSSFLARAQLVTLSVYCGVMYVRPGSDAPAAAVAIMARTAETISSTLQLIHRPLQRLPRLTLRGGGVYMSDDDSQWLADYLGPITNPPLLTCRVCGDEIYFANNAWRHKSTGRDAATRPETGRAGTTIQVLDHYAAPESE